MKQYIIALLVTGVILSACEKKVDPVDTFYVTVQYKSSGPKFVTGDREVNPKDSIYFDFTITSAEDMAYVEIQRNGTRLDTFRLNNAANKKSFSLVKGYMADSAAGQYTYRIIARDSRAIFLGDGNSEITITVKPDFLFWSYRVLKVPDTTAKTNKCYYATTTGNTYNYTEGAANSAAIDFGYYYEAGTLKHTVYALNEAQPQLNFYDITSWTKNATIFKKMPSSVNFVSQLTSSGAINTLIRNNMTSGTASKATTLATSSGNNVIGFRTAAGKYGAILIRYTNQDSPAKETTVEVDVKVQM